MKIKIEPHQKGLRLIEILKTEHKSAFENIDLLCGGKGICGKCRVLVNGKVEKACEYIPVEGDIVETLVSETPGIESTIRFNIPQSTNKGFCIAVDLGTTTVVCALLENSEAVDTVSEMNCQKIWGADVISRMDFACSDEKSRNEIKDAIRSQIIRMCKELQNRNSVEKLTRVVIAANTAMTKILLGEDCSSLIKAPFNGRTDGFSGIENGVEIIVLGGSYAYFGSDLSAGLYAGGFYNAPRPALFIDAGTNGEVALAVDDGVYFSSSAAGPAFETSVESGLYGSEIVNELARCLEDGTIDETGRIEGTGVPFTQKEVRNIQLAKAAVAAAYTCLLKKAGINEKDLKSVFLAGGFGSALNIQNAIKTGLLPNVPDSIFKVLGNASLGGACAVCVKPELSYEMIKLVEEGCYVELFNDKSFNDEFADKMMFE